MEAKYVSSGDTVAMVIHAGDKGVKKGEFVMFASLAGIALDDVAPKSSKTINVAFSGVWTVPYQRDGNDFYVLSGMPAMLSDKGEIYSSSSVGSADLIVGLIVSDKNEADGTVRIRLN